MIFLDASALVAIIAREPDAEALLDFLDTGGPCIHSAITSWETTAALCRSYGYAPTVAKNAVDDFLSEIASRLVAIGAQESAIAALAYEVYGRGRHPAALNMGDCFAYACAKAAGARLLYKGGDFALTDLA